MLSREGFKEMATTCLDSESPLSLIPTPPRSLRPFFPVHFPSHADWSFTTMGAQNDIFEDTGTSNSTVATTETAVASSGTVTSQGSASVAQATADPSESGFPLPFYFSVGQ